MTVDAVLPRLRCFLSLQVNVVLAVTYSGIEERLTKIVLKRVRDKHGGLPVTQLQVLWRFRSRIVLKAHVAHDRSLVPSPTTREWPRHKRTMGDRCRGPKSKSDLAGSAQKVFTVRRRLSQVGSRGSLSRRAGAEVNHQAGSAPQKLAVLAGSVEDS